MTEFMIGGAIVLFALTVWGIRLSQKDEDEREE